MGFKHTQREQVVQIVTSWMEEGLQQGRQEGAKNEALAYTMRLLIRRLGTVDRAIGERLNLLSVRELENLGEALFDFSSPSDLADWLQRGLAQMRYRLKALQI